MKIGIAQQNIDALTNAKIHDLRDAPNVKLLLTGHDHDRQYTVNMENYTYLGSGYAVFINVSAYNDPKMSEMSEVTEHLETIIPMWIDMFAGVFGDKKISNVYIQINASHFDKFGHILERPLMIASLNNATATQIGDWNAFKQYIGVDFSKFQQVIDIDLAYRRDPAY